MVYNWIVEVGFMVYTWIVEAGFMVYNNWIMEVGFMVYIWIKEARFMVYSWTLKAVLAHLCRGSYVVEQSLGWKHPERKSSSGHVLHTLSIFTLRTSRKALPSPRASLVEGRLWPSCGAEALEFLTWPCPCQQHIFMQGCSPHHIVWKASLSPGKCVHSEMSTSF